MGEEKDEKDEEKKGERWEGEGGRGDKGTEGLLRKLAFGSFLLAPESTGQTRCS